MASNKQKGKKVKRVIEELMLDNFSVDDYVEGKVIETRSFENPYEEQTDFNIKNFFINNVVYLDGYVKKADGINYDVTVDGTKFDNKYKIFRIFEVCKIYYETDVTGGTGVEPDVFEILLCDDDDDDKSNEGKGNEGKSNEGKSNELDSKSKVSAETLSKIFFTETPRWDIIFPGFSDLNLLGLISHVSVRTLADVLYKRDNYCEAVTVFDIMRVFTPDSWLNDVIINFYINLLVKKSNDKILGLSSFFFRGVANVGFIEYLKKTLKNTNVFEYKKIIIPTHLDNVNHWTLIVVEPQARTITYFDSFVNLNYFNALSSKISFVVGFLNTVYRAQIGFVPSITWKVKCGNSPAQNNNNDCGVYVLSNARYVMHERPLVYREEDIVLLRQRITFEIISYEIYPTV